jgi:phage-related protein
MQVLFINNRVEKFLDSLELHTRSKIFRLFELLEKYGQSVGMPYLKQIDRRLWELRIHGQQEVRLFATFSNQLVIILHGFIKKSMRIPWNELETARQRLKLVLTIHNV